MLELGGAVGFSIPLNQSQVVPPGTNGSSTDELALLSPSLLSGVSILWSAPSFNICRWPHEAVSGKLGFVGRDKYSPGQGRFSASSFFYFLSSLV